MITLLHILLSNQERRRRKKNISLIGTKYNIQLHWQKWRLIELKRRKSNTEKKTFFDQDLEYVLMTSLAAWRSTSIVRKIFSRVFNGKVYRRVTRRIVLH